jgi:hypothetical protein
VLVNGWTDFSRRTIAEVTQAGQAGAVTIPSDQAHWGKPLMVNPRMRFPPVE